MVMAVDRCVRRRRKLCNQRVFSDVDRVRSSPKEIALHMLQRLFHLGVDVLDQRAATIDIQRLDAETYCQNRQLSNLRRCEQHHIGFIAAWYYRTKFWSRLLAVG